MPNPPRPIDPRPAHKLPRSTVDTHVHVFDPARFAYAAGRSYTPGPADVGALCACHDRLGVERVVLVQPSVYGSDNTCLLDALRRLGAPRARGVAVVDLQRGTPADLDELHRLGVRGIRLNLAVRHETDAQRVRAELAQAAALIQRPDWHVQIHAAAQLLPVIGDLLAEFRVPLVLDHFAGLQAADAPSPSAQASGPLARLLDLLATGRVYVKLSAFYRASAQPEPHRDLLALTRRLIAARPDRLLWGSDWPHTGGGAGEAGRNPDRIEPFRAVDLAASLGLLATLTEGCGDAGLLRQLLVDNPARLYGFDGSDGIDASSLAPATF